jgi:hypothetical protein
MWKVVAFVLAVLAVSILGHFAVRYVRKNPLDPVVRGAEIAVESRDYEVRFQRNGAVSGTYFVSAAASEDWTSRPVNARLDVFGLQTGTEYLRAYPDFHLYGSASGSRLASVATPLSLIAANRETYGELQGLLDRHQQRAGSGGERLCVTLSGESLSLVSAESLEDHHDSTPTLAAANAEPIVYVDRLDVADCSELVAAGRH